MSEMREGEVEKMKEVLGKLEETRGVELGEIGKRGERKLREMKGE